MISRGRGGKIINIASLASEVARATIAPYTAAKGGMKMLTRSMAAEWAKHDIQANAIGPGYIATEMNRALLDDPKFDAWVKSRTPSGRWGKPGRSHRRHGVPRLAGFGLRERANHLCRRRPARRDLNPGDDCSTTIDQRSGRRSARGTVARRDASHPVRPEGVGFRLPCPLGRLHSPAQRTFMGRNDGGARLSAAARRLAAQGLVPDGWNCRRRRRDRGHRRLLSPRPGELPHLARALVWGLRLRCDALDQFRRLRRGVGRVHRGHSRDRRSRAGRRDRRRQRHHVGHQSRNRNWRRHLVRGRRARADGPRPFAAKARERVHVLGGGDNGRVHGLLCHRQSGPKPASTSSTRSVAARDRARSDHRLGDRRGVRSALSLARPPASGYRLHGNDFRLAQGRFRNREERRRGDRRRS